MDELIVRLLAAAAGLEKRSGVRACVIGGVARGVWADARATRDVDVIVDTENPHELLVHAEALGLSFVPAEVEALKRSHMTRFRLPDEPTGKTRIDVLARSHEYYGRVLDRSVVVEALGVRVRVASAEDIVILKVLADRPQDRADVEAIIDAQGERLDRALIEREAAALEIELPAALTPRGGGPGSTR